MRMNDVAAVGEDAGLEFVSRGITLAAYLRVAVIGEFDGTWVLGRARLLLPRRNSGRRVPLRGRYEKSSP